MVVFLFSLLECGQIPAVSSLFSCVVSIKAVDGFRALLYFPRLCTDSVCDSAVSRQTPFPVSLLLVLSVSVKNSRRFLTLFFPRRLEKSRRRSLGSSLAVSRVATTEVLAQPSFSSTRRAQSHSVQSVQASYLQRILATLKKKIRKEKKKQNLYIQYKCASPKF